ncbi:MAG: MerR family transcriptional regulator [Lachnospiraceae bacterium]|nr:MerR family transcriptional regulator [Lachnospiraceae bacterium]
MEKDPRFQLLKIGELATLSGVSVKALRVYEKKNVIRPVEIDEETGYRYYSADQLKQVEALLELQEMGFSLSEISKLLSGECSRDDMVELFDEKEARLKELIWKTEAKIDEVRELKNKMTNGEEAEKLKEMSDDERAWYLAKLIKVSENNVRQLLSDVLWL